MKPLSNHLKNPKFIPNNPSPLSSPTISNKSSSTSSSSSLTSSNLSKSNSHPSNSHNSTASYDDLRSVSPSPKLVLPSSIIQKKFNHKIRQEKHDNIPTTTTINTSTTHNDSNEINANDNHHVDDTDNESDSDFDFDYNNNDNYDDNDSTTVHYNIPPDLFNRLQTFPLFKKAPKSFLNKVASKLTLMQYHPQEYIIKKGDPSKSMYWILKGTVSVTSTDGESIYAELAAGSFFGEIGILFNRPRTATVVARTRVLVGVLTSEALNPVLNHYPLIERRIRDEAQERLAMQEKRVKYDLPTLIPTEQSNSNNNNNNNSNNSNNNNNGNIATSSKNGVNASTLATQASMIPGPVLPPISNSPSPSNLPSNNIIDSSLSIQDFIKNLPIFQNLPSKIIHKVALGIEPLKFNPFEYIIHKDDTDSDIFFIINGEVEVIDHSYNKLGNLVEHTLARLSSGSYFGEMSFLAFLNGELTTRRSASIRSISNLELLVVKSDKLEKLCIKYPFIIEDMRKTADARNKSNNSIHDNVIKTRLSINYLINQQDSSASEIATVTPSNQRPIPSPEMSRSPSPSSAIVLHHPQSQRIEAVPSLFSSNFSFGNPTLEAAPPVPDNKRSRSISPITNLSPSISPVSSFDMNRESTRATSINEDLPFNYRKRKSISQGQEINLSMPPLNPIVSSINNFQNFNGQNSQLINGSKFQYLPHNKRIRLASVSRRRSSILSNNGPLPDTLLLKVFEFLTLPELMKLRIISRRWRQLLYVAPNLCNNLDLTPWNTSVDDKALISITDFVGSRPTTINISNCFHITDEGYSYMVNEIGINGKIKVIKMKSNWEVSAMAIMDLTVPSVGQYLEEIDLSNCRKVRDNVIERLIGWDLTHDEDDNSGHNEVDNDYDYGCKNLKILNVGYCKHLADNVMSHIANHANKRLESLDLTRCTAITDKGFQYWTYKSFPNLKKLSLKDCTFLSDKSIISIANAATNLEILDLNFCCSLTDIAIEVLCMGCPNIRELDLSFCGSAVSDSSLVAISLHMRNLEKLILKGCIRVTRAGVDALLSGCSPLNYINISQCKNAHIYPGRIPAQKLNINPQTKSAFVTAGPFQNIIEIVI
ncbi:hypothetical protein DFJ63DRAFT_318114 [Scheffersomyces coipomensis]|uniref:uncharacterized protein n=1 Tax=Scheffersomyces coipomensis TaxID=1788519 RepID=UPI00315D93FC